MPELLHVAKSFDARVDASPTGIPARSRSPNIASGRA